MVAARARAIYDQQAKERMKAGGGDHKSDKAKSGVANLPHPIDKSRDAAGRAVGGRCLSQTEAAASIWDDFVRSILPR